MEEEKPNLNTGTPWSETEIRDLYWSIDHRNSVEYIADFLCRTTAEVRAQMAELGLEEHKYPRPYPPSSALIHDSSGNGVAEVA